MEKNENKYLPSRDLCYFFPFSRLLIVPRGMSRDVIFSGYETPFIIIIFCNSLSTGHLVIVLREKSIRLLRYIDWL